MNRNMLRPDILEMLLDLGYSAPQIDKMSAIDVLRWYCRKPIGQQASQRERAAAAANIKRAAETNE